MKNIKSLLLIGFSVVTLGLNAQDNQVTHADKLGNTKMSSYVVEYDNSTKTYAYNGCCSRVFDLELSEFDGKKQIIMKENYESGELGREISYFVDEEVFPVTFVSAYKRGSKEQQERLKVIDYSYETRLVVLNDWVYVLDWKTKTDWVIKEIYGKGQFKGVKLVKEAFAAKGKMEAANHSETLQKYLTEAFKKQESLLPKWQADNASLIKRRKDNVLVLDAEIQGRNAEFWNSEEGQAIKKRNEHFEKKNAEDAKSEVTINYEGKELVKFGGEHNATGSLVNPSSSVTESCKKDIYIYRLVGTTYTRAELVNSAGTNCGGNIVVK